MVVQQRQHMDAVGYRVSRAFCRLISMFVFVNLQIPNGCIQNYSGCTAAICTGLRLATRKFDTLNS
jgi:hypothetical protein